MMNPFIQTITHTDPAQRNRSINELARDIPIPELMKHTEELENFRRTCNNLYQRVRASTFLYHLYRFYLMEASTIPRTGWIPYQAYENFLDRRFEEALELLLVTVKQNGPNGT
ncbi:UTP--glucose-1-phosphate uridylyltransferase, partial [bacterium]|nr:UTP--glucose-1-phosphate uridylyltransferase [bacterium]